MAWEDSTQHRILLDAGGHAFRAKLCGGGEQSVFLSRLQFEPKGGRYAPRREACLLEAPSGQYTSPFTHNVLTNFSAFNALLEAFLSEASLVSEKRTLRQLSLSTTARAFEPLRAKVNRWEYFFELLGLGAVREFKAGEGLLPGESGVLIDVGHSQVSVAPVFAGRLLRGGFRALDFGGKALTKVLQEALSATQVDLRRHFELVEEVKHRCCRASPAPLDRQTMAACPEVSFLLPDYAEQRPGGITAAGRDERERSDVLRLSALRYVIPEIVFCPAVVGLPGGGLVDAFRESVDCIPPDLRPVLLKNVVVTGGGAAFPGFEERLYAELVAALPSDAWLGYRFVPNAQWFMQRLECVTARDDFPDLCITKAQYEEHGIYALIDYMSL